MKYLKNFNKINENQVNLPSLNNKDVVSIDVTMDGLLKIFFRSNRFIIEMNDGTFHYYEDKEWTSIDYGEGIDGDRKIVFDQDIIEHSDEGEYIKIVKKYLSDKGVMLKNLYLGEL